MVSKVGISPIRGLLVWSFLAKKSSIPFLSKGVKLLVRKKIFFGKYVWIGQNSYIDASCKKMSLLIMELQFEKMQLFSVEVV